MCTPDQKDRALPVVILSRRQRSNGRKEGKHNNTDQQKGTKQKRNQTSAHNNILERNTEVSRGIPKTVRRPPCSTVWSCNTNDHLLWLLVMLPQLWAPTATMALWVRRLANCWAEWCPSIVFFCFCFFACSVWFCLFVFAFCLARRQLNGLCIDPIQFSFVSHCHYNQCFHCINSVNLHNAIVFPAW